MSKQKSIPQRDTIPQEYTWNTADLYPTDEAWKEEFQTLKSLTQKLEGYAGRLGESAQTLYDYENVAFAQRVVNRPTRVIRKRVPEVLQEVGLAGKYKAYPDELSGGEQQRVALARAIVNRPDILLADEPTGNLDSKTTQEVIGLIKRTSHLFKQTIVMITHNEDIAQLADRIIKIEDGKLRENNDE